MKPTTRYATPLRMPSGCCCAEINSCLSAGTTPPVLQYKGKQSRRVRAGNPEQQEPLAPLFFTSKRKSILKGLDHQRHGRFRPAMRMLFKPLPHCCTDLTLGCTVRSRKKPSITDITDPRNITPEITGIDILCRLTGIEFLVLPPHTNKIISGNQCTSSIWRV